MAGRDERKRLLRQLKAREAELSRNATDATQARVGEPMQWPLGSPDGRPTLAGTVPTVAGTVRITIRETEDGLGVHVPPARKVFGILFLIAWLAGWAAGEWFALSEVLRGGFGFTDLFLIVWLAIWSIGGLAVMHVLLRMMFGTDRLFITGGALVVETGFGPLSRRKVWRLDEVGSFARPGTGPHSRMHNASKGIAFTAGGRRRYFGAGMTGDEVDLVLAAIHRHLPVQERPAAAEA